MTLLLTARGPTSTMIVPSRGSVAIPPYVEPPEPMEWISLYRSLAVSEAGPSLQGPYRIELWPL
jgi:hypothetical protein